MDKMNVCFWCRCCKWPATLWKLDRSLRGQYLTITKSKHIKKTSFVFGRLWLQKKKTSRTKTELLHTSSNATAFWARKTKSMLKSNIGFCLTCNCYKCLKVELIKGIMHINVTVLKANINRKLNLFWLLFIKLIFLHLVH